MQGVERWRLLLFGGWRVGFVGHTATSKTDRLVVVDDLVVRLRDTKRCFNSEQSMFQVQRLIASDLGARFKRWRPEQP